VISWNWPEEGRWTELKHSYALQGSPVDATVHQEFVTRMFCDVYQKLNIILMFLCWTEDICYSVCGALYGWMLCDCCSVPYVLPSYSLLWFFCFQNSSCTLLGEQKITEQLDSLHYQVVKKLLP